ncbi:MAG: cyclic nucleotide-binding domain-containing protein, partial [Magnetococcales bacterium]|nr:cyclic nucleotide-binding domain-containing protein [Magnetococcales bacterium]
MNTMTTIVEHLQRVDIFRDIDAGSLGEIAANARHETIASGERIVSEGEYGHAMYLILEGAVEVVSTGEDGTTLNRLAELGRGDHFGEQSLLPGSLGRRNATIQALSSTRLLEIPRKTFLHALTGHPERLDQLRSMGNRQIADNLKKMSTLFRSIPLGPNAENALKQERFSDGDVVIREGESGERFYIIVSGGARVVRERGSETELLTHLGAGSYFGELALINDEPRQATVIAEGSLSLISLEGNAFRELLRATPDLRDSLEHLNAAYSLPSGAMVTLHPTTFLDMAATMVVSHYPSGKTFTS